MLGRAPASVPALVTSSNDLLFLDSSGKRFCKAWPRSSAGSESVVEPTSVLDIRSPSPSSTLSSSLAGSCEGGGGGLGSIESGAVAVSGLFCEGASEGQLPDCTSLLDGAPAAAGKEGSVWSLATADGHRHQYQQQHHHHHHSQQHHGRAVQDEFVGGWQAAGGADSRQGWTERINVPDSSSNGSPAAGFVDKQFAFPLASDKAVKSEAVADGSLEACIMPFSCRKRDREDFLGEVVQRTTSQAAAAAAHKVEPSGWMTDWPEFQAPTVSKPGSAAAPPNQLDDLDEIFVGSPAPPLAEFWLHENPSTVIPQQQQHQVQGYVSGPRAGGSNSGGAGGPSRAQLDLYEAVQAGLLYRGNSGGGGAGTVTGTASMSAAGAGNSTPAATVLSSGMPQSLSPMSGFPRHGAASFVNPMEQSFPMRPVQMPFRHFGGATPFMDTKPAVFRPSFSAPIPQFQDLPTNYPFNTAPQFAQPKPEFHRDFPDVKQCQMQRILDGDPLAKLVGGGGGHKWPPLKPPETGWQQAGQGQGQVRFPSLGQFPPPPVVAEPPILPHQRSEQAGRRVRLEELSIAERQLSAAADAAGHGDLATAQAILARLNQHSSPKGQQPTQRVVFMFMEALSKRAAGAAITTATTSTTPLGSDTVISSLSSSPLDIINKICAYKSFCEASPIPQFAHFTANQAILEATEGEECVHLIDFELGLGGQWASFMQEFAQRSRGGKAAELRITTMGGETVEMKLAKENLQQFAKEVGLRLEVVAMGVEKLEAVAAGMLRRRKEQEVVVVNFGYGMRQAMADFRSGTDGAVAFLQMIKALSPKVVTVVDSDGEFYEGQQSMLEAMQFYVCVFESLDATKLPREAVDSIEGFVFGPKIEEVMGVRMQQLQQRRSDGLMGGGALLPWRMLLQKAGFSASAFSAAAQSQAACLVKSPANSGFNFQQQQQGTLQLAWYNRNLISASAWV